MQKKAPASSKISKTIEVDFAKLKASTIDARQTGGDEGLDELEASIAEKGLLQPLVVRTAKGGGYEVTAGRRRLKAIGRLVKAGRWAGPVPVRVREESDEEAFDTSLAENIVRLPMHPIDQFEAFARLRDELELTPAAIAARYGVAERTVNQRLALGSLAPEIRKAWREDKIDAETAKAFASARDQKLQARTFAELKKRGGANAHSVRQALVKDRPRITDDRVAFVGVDAYRAAGGEVVESLFEGDGYLGDGALLDRLVADKLEAACAALVADGWSFAVTAEAAGNDFWRWSHSRPAQPGKATPAEKKRLSSIEAELNRIAKRADRGDDLPDDYDRQEALESEQSEIQDAIEARGFTAAQKAKAGCIVDLRNGRLDITFGLVPNSEPGKPARKRSAVADGDGRPILPNALLVDIGARQTEAVARVLAETPELAIAVAAAALGSKFDAYGCGNSPVRLRAEGMRRGAAGFARTEADGDENLEETDELDDDEDLADGTPGPKTSGFARQFAIAQAAPAKALAVAIARALDLRQVRYKPVAQADIDALIAALPGDLYLDKVRELVSLEDYFKRAPAAIAIAALEEIGGKPQKSAKKADLAESAALNCHDCGWLPPELRHPAYKLTRRIGDPPPPLPAPATKPVKRKGKA